MLCFYKLVWDICNMNPNLNCYSYHYDHTHTNKMFITLIDGSVLYELPNFN